MARKRPTGAPPGADSNTEAQARLRLEHAGKWLAWDLRERRILAVGDTPEEIREATLAAGIGQFIYDWVPPATDRSGGGLL